MGKLTARMSAEFYGLVCGMGTAVLLLPLAAVYPTASDLIVIMYIVIAVVAVAIVTTIDRRRINHSDDLPQTTADRIAADIACRNGRPPEDPHIRAAATALAWMRAQRIPIWNKLLTILVPAAMIATLVLVLTGGNPWALMYIPALAALWWYRSVTRRQRLREAMTYLAACRP